MELRLVLCLIPFSFLLFSAAGVIMHIEKPFFGAFCAVFLGFITLAALNVLSPMTGVFVPISALTLLVCAVGGVPAAAVLFVLHAFLL